jgi:hypothetical protein
VCIGFVCRARGIDWILDRRLKGEVVKLRTRYLPVAAVLGAVVAIAPTLAVGSSAPSEVKLEVNENCVDPDWPCWAAPGSSSPALRVEVAVGGAVMFTDHETTKAAVVWMGSAPACTGVPTSEMNNWEGRCEFTQEGTYKFESATLFDNENTPYGNANYRKYEIVVKSASTGTTSTTTTTTTPTTTPPTTTTSTTPTPTITTPTTTTTIPTTPTVTTSTQPSGGGASTATTPGSMGSTETPPPVESHPVATFALANAQHGDAVHGTVQIPAADGGARLEVELLAQSASLAKVKRVGSSRVGRLVRSSAPAGTVSFTVSLDAQAKRVLRHRHKLALTVKIVLISKHGTAMILTRSVVVR